MNKIKTELKWAVIFLVMTIVWMWLEKLAGLHDKHIDKHAFYTNLIAIPSIIIYALALLDKKKNYYNGRMSYSKAFLSGIILTIIITVFYPLVQIVVSKIITPEYFSNAIQYAVENNMQSPEEAKKYFSLKNYIIQGIIGAPVMGILTTLVISIFVKSKR